MKESSSEERIGPESHQESSESPFEVDKNHDFPNVATERDPITPSTPAAITESSLIDDFQHINDNELGGSCESESSPFFSVQHLSSLTVPDIEQSLDVPEEVSVPSSPLEQAALRKRTASVVVVQLEQTSRKQFSKRPRRNIASGDPVNKPIEPREAEWEVETIVNSKIEAETYIHYYEIKWKGFSAKNNTWEPKINLAHCRDAIEEFENRQISG